MTLDELREVWENYDPDEKEDVVWGRFGALLAIAEAAAVTEKELERLWGAGIMGEVADRKIERRIRHLRAALAALEAQ